ncbi:MAG: transcription factor FapR [Halothermotrichaceae bacterium]
MKKYSKRERQKLLKENLNKNPLLTDKELADRFNVSIQTIRLDRLELGIPELRERTRSAASAYARLKSVNEGEVIGELLKLKLDKSAESILETTEDMALQRSKIIRGHYLFAQANSLAVATVDAKSVLTGTADLKFHQKVHIGDKIVAKAEVKTRDGRKYIIKVNSYHGDKLVFSGDFIMFIEKR